MAAQSAPKVVLKSTTKMSLNERFTNMLKNKQPMPVNIRATMQQQQLASARNRRLAQQMENRPSVQAALKLKQRNGSSRGPGAAECFTSQSHGSDSRCRSVPALKIPPQLHPPSVAAARSSGTNSRADCLGTQAWVSGTTLRLKRVIPTPRRVCCVPNPRLLHDSLSHPNLLFQKSLKQRLGKSNIQARLGRPAGTLARGALGGRGLALGQRGMPRGALRGRGARAMIRGGVALRGQALLRGGRGIAPRMGLRRGGIRGRGGPGRGGLGRGAMGRGGIGGRGRGMAGRGRGGFGGRGRGRGRGRGSARPVLTKEQLDNQLDAYMSKTKGHLDAELDAYMAQTDPEATD